MHREWFPNWCELESGLFPLRRWLSQDDSDGTTAIAVPPQPKSIVMYWGAVLGSWSVHGAIASQKQLTIESRGLSEWQGGLQRGL